MQSKPEIVVAKEVPGYESLLPETYETFTVVPTPKGWLYVVTTINAKTKRVVKQDVSEPDMKPLIMEKFKIGMVRYWKRISG